MERTRNLPKLPLRETISASATDTLPRLLTSPILVNASIMVLLLLLGCSNPTGAGSNGGGDGSDGGEGGSGEATWQEIATLLANDRAADDEFGTAVAVSGDTVVVGAHREDDGSTRDTGAAYVFVRGSDGSWTQQAKLTADGEAALDALFGQSVGISGDSIIVGAPGEDDEVADPDRSNAGAAYVFVRDSGATWSRQARLTADTTEAGAEFGRAVAIHADIAIVGAPLEDRDSTNNAGAAYLFERDGSDQWGSPQRITGDSDNPGGDQFGSSVAITSDKALIGAVGDDDEGNNAGAVYTAIRGATVWSVESTKLTASDGGAFDLFGTSVALSGETAAVGAPTANASFETADSGAAYLFVFDADLSAFGNETKLLPSDPAFGDQFGISVAISGENVLVGASENDISNIDEGAVYLFSDAGDGGWSEIARFTDGDGASFDLLGSSVAIDGPTAVAGAPGVSAGANDTGKGFLYRYE